MEMAEYIERGAAIDAVTAVYVRTAGYKTRERVWETREAIQKLSASDVAPVVHGRWILEAHDERVNYRWNVTAECSECCDEQKEIWAGFFPNVPPSISRDAALVSAESVKLSNYCPNCGAKMDGDSDAKTD